MEKFKGFNYESEDLTNLSTRIPKEFKELLKLRASIDGVSIQDIIIYLIGNYILSDHDKNINELIEDLNKKASERLM